MKKKIKILRTDNGTECESYEFNDFCRGAGIKRETSTVYAPEKMVLLEERREDPHGLETLSKMPRDIWPQRGKF